MKCLIVSDSHGNREALERVLSLWPQATTVFFLGDGLREAEDLAQWNPTRRFVMVAGNCDLYAQAPLFCEEVVGSVRLFLTHGHAFSVKNGLHSLYYAARERQTDIALFGHTHIPLNRPEPGCQLFNPGSVGKDGNYGLLDLSPAGLSLQNLRL